MFKTIIHYIYWILIFFVGVFQLMGFESSVYKVGVPFIVLLLFLNTLLTIDNVKFPFVGYFIAFTIVGIVSKQINNINDFSFIYFLTYTVFSYLYFVVLVNEKDLVFLNRLIRFLIILFLIQIPFSLGKFISMGQSEHGLIGTLTTEAGSVSTILPMFCISILSSLFFFKKDKIYLVLILFYVLFGIIGDKRAIIYFVPVVMLIAYSLYLIKSGKSIFFISLKGVVFLPIFILITFYFSARLLPSMNPENKIWGSFDPTYIKSYTEQYTTDSRSQEELRRKDAIVFFFNYMLEKEPIGLVFGDGAGKLIQSKYNQSLGTMSEQYGVRYGGRMGMVWLLLQVGFLGLVLFLLFLVHSFLYVWNNYKSHPLYLCYLTLTVVFFIDLLLYSNSFIRNEYFKGVYFLIFALIKIDVMYGRRLFSNHESLCISI